MPKKKTPVTIEEPVVELEERASETPEPIKEPVDAHLVEQEKVVKTKKEEPTVTELQAHIERLENMLRATADAGRLMNFDTQQSQGKKPIKVKLSEYMGGLVVGWRTIKDQLIQHPTTGKLVGEEQQYELLVQLPTGDIQKHVVNSYQAFSEARYGTRIEAEVVGKREGYGGELTFEIALPDGRRLQLDSRFIN